MTEAGVAPLTERLRLERGLAFSFNRRDADPERASRDLVLVIDTLAALPGPDAALEAAAARLQEERGDEAAFRAAIEGGQGRGGDTAGGAGRGRPRLTNL